MTGKSQAATIYAKAKCELDPTVRIGVTCKSTYKRLIAQGIPEENLIMLPKQEDKPLEFWYDEAMDFLKINNIDTIVGELK